ncbi:hypothetical protein ZHAS_00002388 [Anopheles sinensis]|uniref:Uncharacterized protein n=1 Tax=Anopheles sinensis TaxID=74873 RepID=A0A084VC53_ANOSI|nr:hypothetical protein ZHAS_00002388 [Anopheles sinensis]
MNPCKSTLWEQEELNGNGKATQLIKPAWAELEQLVWKERFSKALWFSGRGFSPPSLEGEGRNNRLNPFATFVTPDFCSD